MAIRWHRVSPQPHPSLIASSCRRSPTTQPAPSPSPQPRLSAPHVGQQVTRTCHDCSSVLPHISQGLLLTGVGQYIANSTCSCSTATSASNKSYPEQSRGVPTCCHCVPVPCRAGPSNWWKCCTDKAKAGTKDSTCPPPQCGLLPSGAWRAP